MYAQQINGVWQELVGNVVFSPNVYQTAESLSDEQRAEFGVYLIVDMPKPALAPDEKLGEPSYAINGVMVERTYPAVPKTEAELAADALAAREQLKAQRTAAVAAITVTTAAGNTFDGDETSQTRMARAIIGLQATGTPSLTWVLADNTVIQATAAELTEAMALAGAAQAAIWVIE